MYETWSLSPCCRPKGGADDRYSKPRVTGSSKMSQQLLLKLGHPSENPEVLESMEVPGWSMMSSTTGWLRSLWANDYLDRVLHPERDPITLEDCQVANAARHKF